MIWNGVFSASHYKKFTDGYQKFKDSSSRNDNQYIERVREYFEVILQQYKKTNQEQEKKQEKEKEQEQEQKRKKAATNNNKSRKRKRGEEKESSSSSGGEFIPESEFLKQHKIRRNKQKKR